jgi:hypothetical protein
MDSKRRSISFSCRMFLRNTVATFARHALAATKSGPRGRFFVGAGPRPASQGAALPGGGKKAIVEAGYPARR